MHRDKLLVRLAPLVALASTVFGEHLLTGQKFTGSANGITTKIPRSAFSLTSGVLKVHKGDNGSGTLLTREFCGECGSGILEYGVSAYDA